jgi:anthranilate phosphoribosyltransferase
MTTEDAILALLDGQTLTDIEMEFIMNEIMEGEVSPIQIGAFLVLLRQKGEEVEEIFGASKSILAKAIHPDLGSDFIDTCGTGGDGSNTFNISTAGSLLAHACGVKIAKHGNRSVSSRCGSADVLEHMGFKIDLNKEQAEHLYKETGFVFLFAPLYHSAMKVVAPVRRELGIRTIFNMLGPLLNPAGAKRQVIGVYSKELTGIFTQVLRQLEARHCIILHGQTDEGHLLDEPSVCGPTFISELNEGMVLNYTVHPEDFGLKRHTLDQLLGGDVEENHKIMWQIFDRQAGEPKHDATIFASGLACYVSGVSESIQEGIDKSKQMLYSGQAKQSVEELLTKHRELCKTTQ